MQPEFAINFMTWKVLQLLCVYWSIITVITELSPFEKTITQIFLTHLFYLFSPWNNMNCAAMVTNVS